ncbi:MAG: hypothetical protein AAF329_01180 [Cyanobacteria bacterium P01_A01_bin.17]
MPTQQRQHHQQRSEVSSANERVNYLLGDYDRVTKSLDSAKRQLKIHKLCHFAAIVIVCLDSYFSYTVLSGAGQQPWFSLALSLFICAVQWQVNMAIFNRRFAQFIAIDRNRDGQVTASEWIRWGFVMLFVMAAYLLNIGTNMIGVDGYGLGSLAFAVPGIPEWQWIAAVTTFFFSALLCFGDELIHMLADDNTAALKRRIPDLQNQQAVLDARLTEAQAFRAELLNHAEDQGMRRGADYRI